MKDLVTRLGIGPREMVSFVGAGGKSTMLLTLGAELLAAGHSVVMTTTTKMAIDQIPSGVAVAAPDGIGTIEFDRGVFLVEEVDGEKIVGIAPAQLDALFLDPSVEYVLIEADGARRRSFKAPAAHEPVIPSATTLVVAIAGLGVIGEVIAEVAHRPEQVTRLVGKAVGDRVSAADIATVVGSSDGGLKGVPVHARVVAVLTGVESDAQRAHAAEIEALLDVNPRIERVLTIGRVTPDRPPR